jgi:hypothetical protein
MSAQRPDRAERFIGPEYCHGSDFIPLDERSIFFHFISA